ncbi:unnamed protein product [Symbiodinium necroappetens]|uniref:Uncharacterized protein n=1 Tax=Symbiodinium necroappetens TaxID=1628268 RepID=A0A812XW41_9DINO|nr:unnamed protein product [Symbiodinium necroappetens]
MYRLAAARLAALQARSHGPALSEIPRAKFKQGLGDVALRASKQPLQGAPEVSGSQVSSGSNSSVQGGIQFYQPKDSTKDLKVFSDAITGHLQIVLSCLSEADQDLLSCAVQTENQFVSLVCSAQTVACKLAATACNALEKLPTLLWAARGHGSTELSDCIVGLRGNLGTLRKETQGIRSDYIDLLTQVQYMGHCTQVTVDQTVMSLLPEPSEKEDGSMECQIPPSLALALQEANEESQKYLELTLLHLDYMSQILEECSDFWLMLHQAELQLRKLEKADGTNSELYPGDRKFWSEICSELFYHLKQQSPRNISLVLSSLARKQLRDVELLDHVAAHLDGPWLTCFNIQDLTLLCNSYAQLSHAAPQLFRNCAEERWLPVCTILSMGAW